MQTIDELNISAHDAVTREKTKGKDVGGFFVPRMTRADSIRVIHAVAPFFSKRIDAEPQAVFEVIYDPDYQDVFMAAYLNVEVEKIQSMDFETYSEIEETFNDLNPNFISDVTNEEAAKAVLRHALTQNISA